MSDCRCAWECNMCRWDRLNYTGCKCPGCAPKYEPFYKDSLRQSPVEYARTLGILYRQERVRICDARKIVLGEIQPQFPKEST